MGVLSRVEMEQAIIQKGSVLYQGRTITRIQDLPSEAELAAGNPEQEQAVRDALDTQIAALEAQRARLGAGGQSPQISPEKEKQGAETPPAEEGGGGKKK